MSNCITTLVVSSLHIPRPTTLQVASWFLQACPDTRQTPAQLQRTHTRYGSGSYSSAEEQARFLKIPIDLYDKNVDCCSCKYISSPVVKQSKVKKKLFLIIFVRLPLNFKVVLVFQLLVMFLKLLILLKEIVLIIILITKDCHVDRQLLIWGMRVFFLLILSSY